MSTFIQNVKANPRKWNLIFLGFIVCIVIITFSGSIKSQFIQSWDDGTYVINNPAIKTLHGDSIGYTIKQSFKNYTYGHYHPLTMISYALDYRLSELDPSQYHLTNLIIHILNCIAVFVFIWLLTSSSLVSFIVSLLFAIHPAHVESVMWISDRKDLLCTFFYISSLCFYLKYIKNPTIYFYALFFICFILALLSKAMAVTLPVLLFAIDYFQSRKINLKIIMEKVPMLALSLVFGYVSILAQRHTGALVEGSEYGIFSRILLGCYATAMYLYKAIAMFELSPYYNYPLRTDGSLKIIVYVSPLIILIAGYFLLRIKLLKKELVFGLMFFLITVGMVLQFVPAGNVIIADRYTYLPFIGLFFIMGISMEHLESKSKLYTASIVAIFVLFLSLCGLFTINQIKIWHDPLTFWNKTIEQSPRAAIAFDNRGVIFTQRGQYENALVDYNKAIELEPEFSEAHYNRGIVYASLGKYNDAIADYTYVISKKPNEAVFSNRGIAYMFMGNYSKAIEDYSAAIDLDPNFYQGYHNRGLVLLIVKDYENAIKDFAAAIQRNDKFALAYYLKAKCLIELKDTAEARKNVQKAQQLGFNIEPEVAKLLK